MKGPENEDPAAKLPTWPEPSAEYTWWANNAQGGSLGGPYLVDLDYIPELEIVQLAEARLAGHARSMASGTDGIEWEIHILDAPAPIAVVSRPEDKFFVGISRGFLQKLFLEAFNSFSGGGAGTQVNQVAPARARPLFWAIVDFLVGHEFAHGQNGHLGLIKQRHGLGTISETGGGGPLSALDFQTLEMDADAAAFQFVFSRAMSLTYTHKRGEKPAFTIPPSGPLGTPVEASSFLGRAVVILFLVCNGDVPIPSDAQESTHPPPVLRFYNVGALFGTLLEHATNLDVRTREECVRAFVTAGIDAEVRFERAHPTAEAPPKPALAMHLEMLTDPTIAEYALRLQKHWAVLHPQLVPLKLGPGRLAPPQFDLSGSPIA